MDDKRVLEFNENEFLVIQDYLSNGIELTNKLAITT